MPSHTNPLRRQTARSRVLALAAACLSLVSQAALAWGADGHRLVATVAEGMLTPTARSEINRLLALEPGATLASISTWADEVRNPATAAWHYVNFPREGSCTYNAEQLCPGGACVVSAIERQAAVLGSAEPDVDRLRALKYVVHFVGDIHQPLHAGYADDRGGNSYQLQAFGRGSNLHSVWDSGLIRNWPGGLPALQAAVEADSAAGGGTAQGWAEISCRIVATAGFYPPTHQLEADYPDKWNGSVVHQLSLASRRLAETLNRLLVTRP
jgi:hypothetical protein